MHHAATCASRMSARKCSVCWSFADSNGGFPSQLSALRFLEFERPTVALLRDPRFDFHQHRRKAIFEASRLASLQKVSRFDREWGDRIEMVIVPLAPASYSWSASGSPNRPGR